MEQALEKILLRVFKKVLLPEIQAVIRQELQEKDNQKPKKAPMVDIKGAAEFLSISPAKMRQFIRGGDIKTVRVGGQVRIMRSELENYIEKHSA